MSSSEITSLINTLQHQNFYGALEVKFEAGRVVLLKKTETIKPTEPNYATKLSEPNYVHTKR